MARLALIVLLLAGCATTAPVPVAVPCVAAADVPPVPAWLVDTLPADASPAELIRALWGDYLQRRGYVPQLQAIIGACIDGSN